MPQISIVLPVYNGEKYLAKSIESILKQTFEDWELIIVDDCSTDSTAHIIAKYMQKDARIKMIHNKINQNLPGSLNIGFEKATGEYLTWTSDDNMYLPDALHVMYEQLSKDEKLYMVCADMKWIDEHGKVIGSAKSFDEKSIYVTNLIGACFLYKKEVLEGIGGYDSEMLYVEDYDYWIRITKKYGRIKRIDKCLYAYRRHGNSLTQTKKEQVIRQLARLREKHVEFLAEGLKNQKKLLCQRYYEMIENGVDKNTIKESISKYLPELKYEDEYDGGKAIIFGAGQYGEKAADLLGDNVVFFADNDKNKVGLKKDNIEIISFEKMLSYAENYRIVVAVSEQNIYDLIHQLYLHGIRKYSTYLTYRAQEDIKDITISVVVPIYNVEKYLKDCLNSLVNQSRAFTEIILVNDGSNDGSKEICEDYCKKYKNIRLINQKNQGLSVARNVGMQHAKSDYLLFVDADDYIRLDTVEVLEKKLQNNDVEVLYFNAQIFNELKDTKCDENQFVRDGSLANRSMSGMEYFENSFASKLIVSACTAIYKKEFLDEYKIDFPKGLYYEDNVFFIEVVLKAHKVACIEECLYIRRIREDSIMTGALSLKKCKDMITIQQLISKLLFEDKKKEIYQKLFKDFISARMLATLDITSIYDDDSELREQKKKWMQTFVENWLPFYRVSDLSWNDAYLLLRIVQFLDMENEYFEIVENARFHLKEHLKQKLEKLPFQNHIGKIGIYGIGNHTKKMFTLYQKFFGEISANIYFMVSSSDCPNTFMGKQVLPCKEIPEDTEGIVLSSLIYQNEMKQQLQKCGIDEKKVIGLYEPQDKCDLVMVEEILHMK